MSDTNRTSLLRIAESAYGVLPGTPAMRFTRFTTDGLKQTTQTTSSQEVRSDRQIADIVRNGISGAGDLGIEMSYGTYDDFFAALLFSAAFGGAPDPITGLVLTVVASTNKITRPSGSWITDGLSQYMWVKTTGFTNAANNGYFKITAISATDLTLSPTSLLTNETSGTGATVLGSASITNGTTLSSFYFERRYNDIIAGAAPANGYAQFPGMAIERFNQVTSAQAILTGAFSFVGKKELSGAATVAASTVAASTSGVMNAIDHVKLIAENGGVYGLTDLNQDIRNNLRARLQIATLGAVSLGAGTFTPTGSHKAYYDTKAVMDRYLNNQESALAYAIEDPTGTGAYVFDYPAIKYTDGQRIGGGINTDVYAEMQWSAKRHATEGVTLRIARFG